MAIKFFRVFSVAVFLLFCCLFQFSPNVNGQTADDLINECKGRDYSVNVSTVQPINSPKGQFFSIEYSYNFKGRKTIFIKDVGETPGKGNLKHLYQGQVLEFWSSSAGEVLCKIKLQPNKRPPEGGADDIPASSVFSTFQSSPTSIGSNSDFLTKLTEVLNNAKFTYRINNQGGVTSVISNYQRLDGLPRNLVGEIAVQISFPQQGNGNQFSFYIYQHARQKPRRSEEWGDISSESQKVLNDFIASLIQQLK